MGKLRFRTILWCLFFAFTFSGTAFAGTWQSVGDNWKYQEDDGSYATSKWISSDGGNYYQDSNGIMLKNTMSPDGYPIGRDGKQLTNHEILPNIFTGSEVDYISLYEGYMSYCNEIEYPFNDLFNRDYPTILNVYINGNYENANDLLNHINSFDFTPFIHSENILVRKEATISEIFRIEQVYYLSELIKSAEQQNEVYYFELLDKLSLSNDKYYNDSIVVIKHLTMWDTFG